MCIIIQRRVCVCRVYYGSRESWRGSWAPYWGTTKTSLDDPWPLRSVCAVGASLQCSSAILDDVKMSSQLQHGHCLQETNRTDRQGGKNVNILWQLGRIGHSLPLLAVWRNAGLKSICVTSKVCFLWRRRLKKVLLWFVKCSSWFFFVWKCAGLWVSSQQLTYCL